MASGNSKQIQQQQLAEKIRLEGLLVGPLNGFFKRMDKQFRMHYAYTGKVLSADSFEPELIAMFQKHVTKVVKSFGNNLRKQVKFVSHLEMEYKQDSAESTIQEAFREFIAATSLIQAAFVTKTNNKVFQEAVQRALYEFTTQNKEITQQAIAKRAYEIATIQNLGRVNNIATTLTQNAAEGSKFVEARTLIELQSTISGIPVKDSTEKEWNTVLDGVTRPAHVIADGQRVNYDEPFLVDGELLMHPGDVTLGATAKNTCHCRCGSQYVLSEFMLSAEQVDTRRRDYSKPNSPVIQE